MGIILFPYILIAIFVLIIALILAVKSFLKKELIFEDIFLGLITTLCIYILIYINYKISEEAYGLGTYFIFPFFMIFLPFITSFILKLSKKTKTNKISNILLVSVILSGIFIIVFEKYTFGLIEYLELTKYH
jgi:hypothetical protein